MRPDDTTIQAQIYAAQEHGLKDGKWKTQWPGTTYEQGVCEALRWALGQTAARPMPS